MIKKMGELGAKKTELKMKEDQVGKRRRAFLYILASDEHVRDRCRACSADRKY